MTLDLETRIWMELSTRTERVLGPIEVIGVESGALCNLSCPFCPTGNGELRLSREFLDPARFKTILDEAGTSLKRVILFAWGEPLLHPRLDELLAQARSRGLFTSLSTNLSLAAPLFTRERARRLVESGLGRLEVACDGARQATYGLYRVGGDFNRVLSNLRLLLEERRAAAPAGPEIVWTFHVHPRNEKDLPLARRKAAELGVPIEFRPLYIPESAGEEWRGRPARPKPPRSAAVPVRARGMQCLRTWTMPLIHSDGSVFPCCVAIQPEHSLGNVFTQGLTAIWNGPRVRAMRRYLRTGARTQAGLPCYGCPHDPHGAR